jgi:hypothetical protein
MSHRATGVETFHALDSCAQDLFGEVVRADVATNRKRFTAGALDLVDDGLGLLLIKADEYTCQRDTSREHRSTHSETTTFAPSRANSSAVLRPMPCDGLNYARAYGRLKSAYLASACIE